MSNHSLNSPALYILLTLLHGERHGYAIMKEVAKVTDGDVKLGPATLYTAIKRLLEAGYIKETIEKADPDAPQAKERRRYYALTSKGQHLAHEELDRMQHLVKIFKTQSV